MSARAVMAAVCVKEKRRFLLMSATNIPSVQSVTGLKMLTARETFVMRWIPDLSVARTLSVRILGPVTTALMLTAQQASTVLFLTSVQCRPPVGFGNVSLMTAARSQTALNMLIQSPSGLPMLHTLTVIMKITECKVNFTSLIYRLQQILGVWTRG